MWIITILHPLRFDNPTLNFGRNWAIDSLLVGAKILISPMSLVYTSRTLSITKLGEFLADNGHEVSIIIPTYLRDLVKTSKLKIIEFQVRIMILTCIIHIQLLQFPYSLIRQKRNQIEKIRFHPIIETKRQVLFL